MEISFPFDRLREAGRTTCAIEIDVRDPEAVSAARSLIPGIPDWIFDFVSCFRNPAIRCVTHSDTRQDQTLTFVAWSSDPTVYQKPNNQWQLRDYFRLSELLFDDLAIAPVDLSALL